MQAKTLDKGLASYLVKAAAIGGVGGLIVGIVVASLGGEGFDFLQGLKSIVARQILTTLLCAFPFALVAVRVAWTHWKIITWETFTLNFNIGDGIDSILKKFGAPTNRSAKKDTVELFYKTLIDKNRRIEVKNMTFIFANNKLVKFNRF
ncbi:hypothetical protein GCM10027159_14190 [Lysobacter terrae]